MAISKAGQSVHVHRFGKDPVSTEPPSNKDKVVPNQDKVGWGRKAAGVGRAKMPTQMPNPPTRIDPNKLNPRGPVDKVKADGPGGLGGRGQINKDQADRPTGFPGGKGGRPNEKMVADHPGGLPPTSGPSHKPPVDKIVADRPGGGPVEKHSMDLPTGGPVTIPRTGQGTTPPVKVEADRPDRNPEVEPSPLLNVRVASGMR
jgi:hypothetical protein